MEHGAKDVGGSYIKRKTKEKQQLSSSQYLVEKLIMNSEVEMSEFSFDIKLYENIEVAQDRIISYIIEIFNLNDPDTIYRYNHSINPYSTNIQTSMDIGVDLFNLIDHPHKKQNKEQAAIYSDQEAAASIESLHKKNFQELFNKYIDNRLMLMVQEQKFPNKIGFSIVEPNSKLLWSY